MEDASTVPSSFQRHQIQVQEAFTKVRKRPGMYIGNVDAHGILHMVEELIDNSIAEVRIGACTRIDITIADDDTVTVEDNGRGIPVVLDQQTGLSSLDRTMTDLGGGWKARDTKSIRDKVAGGLHGVGVPVVTALAEWLEVEVRRDGRRYRQAYVRGVPRAPVSLAEDAPGSGTRISFRPDRQILYGDISYELLEERVRELAFLNSSLQIMLRDERPGQYQEHSCCFADGITAFVRYLNRRRWRLSPAAPLIHIVGAYEEGEIEAAIQYSTNVHDQEEILRAYAHCVETTRRGSHVTAFRAALRDALTTAGRAAGLIPEGCEPLSNEEVSRGLTAVISVHLDYPRFEDNIRGSLGNQEIHDDVKRLVTEQLLAFLTSEPASAREIITLCLTAPRQ